MENNIRIRYGRTKKSAPKNTLVTIRDSELIYFGISRCNTKTGDTFQKDVGKHIAFERAALTQEQTASWGSPPVGGIGVHPSGLRGIVRKEDVRKLIEYFENIDHFNSAGINT